MTATPADFRATFDTVADHYDLSADTRAAAWDSCHKVAKDGTPYLDPYAVRCYRMLAGTQPPYVAGGGL